MDRTARPVALVTGAATGIGLEIVRGLARRGMTAWLTARDASRGEAAARRLRDDGLDVRFVRLDVTSDASVAAAVAVVERESGRLDVLVNDAGVLLDEGTAPVDLSPDVLRATLEVNTVGPLRVTRAFAPLLRRGGHGRVVNVSSTAGSLAEMAAETDAFGGFLAPAYAASKAALNALTISFAQTLRADGVLVNAMCPGWVRTAMGGPSAPLGPEEGADTALWLATLPDDGPTGGFFSERAPTPW